MRRLIPFVFITLCVSPCCAAPGNSVPFQLFRDYLILTKCSVAGQKGLRAVIDTGTTETILDLTLVRRLALDNWADSATSLTQDAPARGVRVPDLQLGPVRVQDLDGVAMDLVPIGRQLGVHPDVVVGMDVLRRANFVVDYDNRIIEFGTSPVLRHRAALAPAARFALLDSDVLGKRLRLQVDTGFNGILVYGSRIQAGVVSVDSGARVAGVADQSGVRTVDSATVHLGNWQAAHVSIAVMEGAPRDFGEFDGLLGPRFLGAKRVAFDFEHRMFYWD